MGTERSAREVAGDMPRETFEKAVEAASEAVCAHRSYRMIAAEVLASVNHAGAVEENRKLWARDHARGHRPTSDCHVCVKVGDASPPTGEQQE